MKVKDTAVILNTNQLGGAERSLIEQLFASDSNESFTFYIPELGLSDDEIVKFLQQKNFHKIKAYSYPSFLYKLSRKDFNKIPLAILTLPGLLKYVMEWNSLFKKHSQFYVNGNKAILPVLVWSVLTRKKIHIIWHFRDFPSPRAFNIIGKLFKNFLFSKIRFKLIANSFAVANELKKFFPTFQIECLYNLAGALPERNVSVQIRRIGIVSMHAPWKGLHTVVLMAKLYEKELKALGIERISFFGEAIYQTGGEHKSYSTQLHDLNKKLNSSLVEWHGKASPEKIFHEIDILIHPSLLPEPFGRVILEAFKSNVPVISTGIGGAAELIGEKNAYGVRFERFDYAGLFTCIKQLCEQPELLKSISRRAFNKMALIESEVTHKAVKILM